MVKRHSAITKAGNLWNANSFIYGWTSQLDNISCFAKDTTTT